MPHATITTKIAKWFFNWINLKYADCGELMLEEVYNIAGHIWCKDI